MDATKYDSLVVTLAALRKFRIERQWSHYHSPRNLAQSVSIEAAELLELWQWGKSPSRDRIADELADVMIYCLNLADVCEIDPVRAIADKISVNERRFPVRDDSPLVTSITPVK